MTVQTPECGRQKECKRHPPIYLPINLQDDRHKMHISHHAEIGGQDRLNDEHSVHARIDNKVKLSFR
jgi:hypothetical protein